MSMLRTTKPSTGDKYFIRKVSGGFSSCIKGYPTDPICDVLANCVGFANGFLNEQTNLGYEKYNLNCNAENFIERAIRLGLSVVKDPVVGGIMVWQKGATLSGKDGAGHVAGVYAKPDNDTVKTSESGYKSKAFWTATRKRGSGNWGAGTGYTYRGCIVSPYYKPEPEPEPKPTPIERPQPITPPPSQEPPITNSGFKKGDIVVPTRLVGYNGVHLRQYDKQYTIIEVKGNRAVLGAYRKGKLVVWAAMNTKDIRRV